jgi:hypothetical protein
MKNTIATLLLLVVCALTTQAEPRHKKRSSSDYILRLSTNRRSQRHADDSTHHWRFVKSTATETVSCLRKTTLLVSEATRDD